MKYEDGYDGPFPYHLVEVLNGVLTLVLFWMLFFLVMHIFRLYVDVRSRHSGPWGLVRAVRRTYSDFKPEVALLVIVTAFWMRSFISWYVLWYKHEMERSNWLTMVSPQILISVTVVLVLGVVCWIRVISPISGRLAGWLWTLMVSSSILFGIGMHYFF
jgi:hypothetical protein